MLLCILIGFLLTGGATYAQTTSDFDSFVRPYTTSNNFSGDILIEHRGKVVFHRAYGYADRERKVANGGATQFHIASVSMQYTSAAILRLVDQHKITLATTVGNLLPNTPGAEKITVQDLLLQQSGLDDINSHPDYDEILQHHQTPAALVHQIDGHPLRFPPGTKHTIEEHSAFNLLALLLENKTGRPFAQAINDTVVTPLQLRGTYADDDGAAQPSAAHGYQPKGVTGLAPAPTIQWSAKAGNASIVTTAEDEVRLVNALFGGKFLTADLQEHLLETTPRVGYGWFRSQDQELHTPKYYMNGRAPGFASYVLHIPHEALTVVVFSNIYSSAPSEIGEGLARIALGLPHESLHLLVNAPKPINHPLRFRFPPDFFQPSADLAIFTDKGGTFLRWPSGNLSPLIPMRVDEWLDRAYWEPVRLHRDANGVPDALYYDRFRGELLR